MPISTPSFWYQKRGLIAYALWPISVLYQFGHITYQKLSKEPSEVGIPVLCMGNAVAGGAGKTPAVIAITNLLKKNSSYKNPFIISRGYDRTETHSKLVDLQKDAVTNVGDEALLLAQHAPTIVGDNRKDSALLAKKNGADIIIMDDGLFNPYIKKDVTILVVDRQMDFGNGFTIPAGPLREPLKKILPKVEAIITIGPAFYSDKPVFETSIVPDEATQTKEPYIGFAGIGYPQKFKATLEDHGYDLIDFQAFADHHQYTDSDLKPLLKKAKSQNARLITTEKDFVRLPAQYKEMVDTLPIELEFEKENEFLSFLKDTLKATA